MNEPEAEANPLAAQLAVANQRLQHLLDKSTPHAHARWAAWAALLLLYILRVYLLAGFYIVTYGLGIYNLNLLLGFITPQVRAARRAAPPHAARARLRPAMQLDSQLSAYTCMHAL